MKKFKNIFNYLLFDQSASQSFDAAQIDVYIKFVFSAITKVISVFISKFKALIRVIFDFDETCNLTWIRANQVRRTFQDEIVIQKNTEQTLQIWRKTKTIKKRIIRKILRINHRNVVSKAIEDAQKTWKFVKWVKNRSTSFKFTTFFFRRLNDTMIFIKKAKIQCLIDFFFFSFAATNLDDIEKTEYSKNIDFLEIIENEINQTIVKMISSIISSENEISNWVIKIVLSHIMLVEMNFQSKSSFWILSQAFQKIHHDVSSQN
jgi:hypothetical protein